MAGSKIKGINIKIGADSRGLDTALKGIEAKSKSARDELKEINRTINKTPQSLTTWKQKQEVLTKAIGDSREKVKLLEDAQAQVAKQLADGKISGEQYRAFQRELENARAESAKLNSEMQETRNKINELGRSAEDTSKDTDKLSDSMDDTRRSADNASDGYTVFKNVLANLATQGINFAFDKLKIFTQQIIETGKAFEASLSNVQAISGATGDEMGVLSEKAKQMGATTKYTASQAADAFGYMALAGWKTQDMLAGIDGVLNLAAGSNMDLALASDIVTDYLTAFGLTAQDSAKFVDQMSYAMSHSNTNTEQLGEAYKNCATTAASMGYSVEETTAVLMTMANAGVKGGEAGTALNAIMTRLATNTKECGTILKSKGVDVYNDTTKELESLTSVLQGTADVWKTLNDEEKAQISKAIAGVNHYSALQTIMNGLSDSAKASGMSFTDYAAALEECDGTAQNMADTMIENLAGDMTILDSAIDGVKIALSEKLNPILRDLVQYITEKMPEIQESSEKALDTVVVIAEWCRKNMPEIKEKFADLLPLISGVASGFVALGTAKTTTKAVKGLVDVVKLLNAAMLANPATAVAVAIGVLGTAITAYCIQAETEMSGLQKISEKIDEQYSKEHKQIDDTRESIKKINKQFDESAEAIDEESRRVEYLRDQLKELVDGNGEVEDANKKRVDYILGELNQALGTEYELTGNQIKGYQNLRNEIDKTIAKKKAEAYFDAYLADSAEMAENKAETKSAYVTASKQRDEAETAMNKAEVEFYKVAKGSGYTAEEIINLSESSRRVQNISDEQYNAAQTYVNAKSEYADATSRQREAEAAYNEIMQYFDTLDRAEKALSEGEYGEVENILYNPQSREQLILENAKDFDEEIKNAYNSAQEELSYELKLAINAEVVNQDEVDEIFEKIGETATLALQKGATPEEAVTVDMREIIQKTVDSGLDLSALTEWGKDSDINITKFLGNNFSEIFSGQVKEGYNVDDFLEWVATSNKKIAKESWSDFKTYVEKEIEEDSEYDITPILKTATDAGINVGETFNGKYTKTVQEQINRGHDPTELLKWWAETDKRAADDFKENYMDITQTMLDNGLDPTDFLTDAAEKDKKFAESFKKNSLDVIQTMLDKGFNPTKMTQWFLDNGVESGDLLIGSIQEAFEKADFSGVKMDGLFTWLDELAWQGADVYGSHFADYVNQFLYKQKVDLGETKPNSAWDADIYKGKVDWSKYNFTRYATGGYIPSGNKGIVAEAGPELLEVMNGGIRVTPLHRNASSTSDVGSDSGQKIFYNTYNINNPKMSSDTDIRTLAQKLAAEQRRIEIGRGLR